MANRTPQKKPRTESNRRRASRAKRRRAPALRLVPKLPERFEQNPLVQRAVAQLERREETLNEAFERLQDAYRDLSDRIVGLEKNAVDGAERRAAELFERVRGTELQGRALEELDELLDRVGLMRKAKHLEELEAAKKRARSAGRRAAKRELQQEARASGDE